MTRFRKNTLVVLWVGMIAAPTAMAWQASANAAARVTAPNPKAASPAKPPAQPPGTVAQTPGRPAPVTLEEAMMANIQVETVRSESARNALTATGKVQFNEEKTFRVLAPLPGQVMDLQLRVGDPVAKDQRLLSIKSREVAALVTDYIQGQRDLDLAEKTHAMTQDLFDHQAASRISLQQSENDLAKVKAAIARAEEALSVIGLDPKKAGESGALRTLIPVYSPANGTVIERSVTLGQFVPADSTPLLTIADLSSVWVLVDVFERDIRLIHVGQKVQVTAAAYPDHRFTAFVERIHDKVDTETRTLKVRLMIENPGMLLKPEMFISAAIDIGGGSTLTVPARAVFTEGGNSYVYAGTSARTFERRLVTTTPSGMGRLRILSGLRAGDKVVAEGVLLVDQRQKQQQMPTDRE